MIIGLSRYFFGYLVASRSDMLRVGPPPLFFSTDGLVSVWTRAVGCNVVFKDDPDEDEIEQPQVISQVKVQNRRDYVALEILNFRNMEFGHIDSFGSLIA